MKKVIARLVSLLLIFSLVLPQTAFAYSYYFLTITLSGPDKNGVTQTVESESAKYLSWNDNTLASIAQTMYNESIDKDINKYFDGTGLHDKYYELVTAAREAIDEEHPDSTAWNQWVYDCVEDAAQRDLLMVKSTEKVPLSNLYSLYFAGGEIVAHFTGGKLNGQYTVTIQLTCHYEDDYYDDHKVDGYEVKEKYTGKIIVDHPTAPEGETVHISTYPESGEMVSYIKVVDKYGQPVKVTYQGDGKYDFVMPDCGVTVTGKFQQTPEKPEVTGVANLLDTDYHEPFMIGDDKGLFRPKANIRRAEVAQMFYRLLKNKDVAVTAGFDDVASNAWYTQAVETLASLGVIKGVSDNVFDPDRPITRAEFATICSRFADKVVTGKSFPDVEKNTWASDGISTAATYGWIQGGTDGNFNPNQAITREEAAAIVNRMLYRMGDQIAIDDGQTKEFPDVHYYMWSWYEIAEATYDHDHKQESKFVHEYWVDQ